MGRAAMADGGVDPSHQRLDATMFWTGALIAFTPIAIGLLVAGVVVRHRRRQASGAAAAGAAGAAAGRERVGGPGGRG